MQPNNEQRMNEQDLLALANALAIKMIEPVKDQLNRIEQQNTKIEQMLEKQPPEKLVLTNAKEIGECIGVSEWQARDLMKQPDFPKSITKRKGTYNRGKWKAEAVKRYYKINKNKV